MIGRVARIRVSLGLDMQKPLLFLAQANAICTGLDNNKTLIPNPNPTVPVLLAQIQDATGAQALVGKVKGAAAARNAKFAILLTSLESERMVVQALCDASPELAPTLIAAASMTAVTLGGRPKPLLGLKNGQPSGTVLLRANASLLDSSNRRKSFNWQGTTDGGKTFFAMPSTPTGKTSIGNLTPLATVGFQVSITIHDQAPSPWSQTESVLVR